MSSRVVTPSPTLAQRYWSYVDRKGPDECWPWLASVMRYGHGQIWVGYNAKGQVVMAPAHRVGWELAHGEAPGVLHVRHRCDNPPCQNPAHLELGTHLDNMKDMVDRGRLVNVRGSKHGKAKLTEQDVIDIRALHAAGHFQSVIAEAHGITQANVSCIVKRQTWRHI